MKDEPPKSTPPSSPDSHGESRASPDTEQLAAQMSALLADLVRTPESDLADWTPSLQVGDKLGRFTLVRELGRGGMGVVWEAEDPELARRVALKVVRPGANARVRGREWLQREAEAVARLSHPNIVTLFDFGLAHSGPFLVFELLRGQPLDKRLRTGPLPYDSALAIAVEVGRALVHAHRAGVVHRDLKPANIYVSDAGDVKVLDFGLANLLGRTGPREGGTPAFMAPEQWLGELGDERTDLFALGVTLWATLTGGVPYAVKDGRSAVEEPGPTPRLPSAVAPPRFRRLVERCLERDPARRPASSKAVLDALRALEHAHEGRWRRRIYAGLTAAALTASLVAGWFWWAQEPPPGERLVTVIADVDNQSGDPNLDGLSGLLTTSLEPSRRLLLVPRVRLLAMAREARLGDLPRLDARAARDLARLASAQVLLLSTARREGAGLVVELKGLEPTTDRPLFTVAESARSAEEVPRILEQLAETVRRKLQERGEDLRAGRLSLSTALSPSLPATRAYFEGLDCLDRPGAKLTVGRQSCTIQFERALSLDPAFSAAHLQLAAHAVYLVSLDEARAHVQAALRGLDRLPAREAGLLRGLSAQLDGRYEDAVREYDALLSRHPDDAQALSLAAELRDARSDWAGELPYLERQLALDPQGEVVLMPLVWTYLRLGRADELKALVESQRALPLTVTRARTLATALLWLGEGDAALAVARRHHQAADTGSSADLLASVLMATLSPEGAEPLLRRSFQEAPGELRPSWALARCLAMQGRFRAALAVLDEARDLRERGGHSTHLAVRAQLVAGTGEVAALWAAATQAASLDESNADLALLLALAGDLPGARRLAASLPKGSPALAEFEALETWRRGDAAGALALLARAEKQEPLTILGGVEPAFLMAEVSAASGQPRETLAAVARVRRLLLDSPYRAWALPRTRELAARAHLALGDTSLARAELQRLVALWGHADADFRPAAEARRLLGQLQ